MPADDAALPPGEVVGRYVKTERLGEGGMGEVWKAFDPELRRWVALKFLKGDDPTDIARFRQEARTAAQLAHPNIAAIHEVGDADGRPFIAMQFVDGRPLKDYARRDTRLAVALVRDVALAIDYAHRRGVVHRDIKPANVMVEATGRASEPRVYVMDFGLAKRAAAPANFTLSGALLGTPAYMSPEQARGETRAVGARSDVYALGATLYELLCGQPPFTGDSLLDVLQKAVADEPPTLRTRGAPVDGDLEAIVAKCLEKDPADRYRTARDLADDLSRWLKGDAVRARSPSFASRLVKLARRHAALFAVVSAALVLGGAIAVLGSGLLQRPPAPHRQEPRRSTASLIFATEDGNAPDLYRALALRLPPLSPEVENYIQGIDSDRSHAAACVAQSEAVLAEYTHASRMRTCEWKYREGFDRETLLPQAASIRNASRILCARARLRASERRLDDAAQDIVTVLKLGCDLLLDRTIVSHLTGIVCMRYAFETFRDALAARASAGPLEFVETHVREILARYPTSQRMLDCEKQTLVEGVDGYLALDAPALARQFPSMARHGALWERLAPFVQKNRTLARRTARARIEERFEQLAAELAQQPLSASDASVDLAAIAREAAEALGGASVDPVEVLRRVADLIVLDSAPKMPGVRRSWAYGRLALEELRIACALQRRKLEGAGYPVGLGDAGLSATDPWDGLAIKYERRGNAFVLTTAGPTGDWRERNRILADECEFEAVRFRARSEELAALLPVTFWCAPR